MDDRVELASRTPARRGAVPESEPGDVYPRIVSVRLALALAALVATAASVTLFGYVADWPRLVVIVPGQSAMSIPTALLCLALAAAVWAEVRARPTFLRIVAAGALVLSAVLLVSCMVTGQDALSAVLLRLMKRTTRSETSGAAALCCFFLAAGCLTRPRRQPAAAFAVAAILVSALALLGYAYGVGDLYALAPFRTFSIRSALCILGLGVALLLANRHAAFGDLLLASTSIGRATRRQLSFLVLPPVAGLVLLRAISAHGLGPNAAMACLVMVTVAPLAMLILRDAKTATVALEAQRAKRLADADKLAIQDRYRSLFTELETGFCVVEVAFGTDGQASDYRFLECNPAFLSQTGLVDAEGRWMRQIAPDHEQSWFDMYGRVALTGEAVRFEQQAASLGRYYDVYAFRVDVPDLRHVAILFSDITGRRQAELDLKALNETLEQRVAERARELETTQEALRQSQKMEAVGQLTGGLAHDFNNLLTGITGSLDLLQRRLAQGRLPEADRYIATAQNAAMRAASLTHRLLAFSRRQTLAPKPTDIVHLIGDLEDLIRRTIGPAVTLVVAASDDVWVTLVDPSQLENAVLNLCINARDAMPDGGRLEIDVRNRWLDEPEAKSMDLPAGDYVSLRVADDGTGMSADVAARAFDPFFTTKPIGKGTGLGLSMIYGFARQSGGQVRIRSELGAGTAVQLYLPRHHGHALGAEHPTLRGVAPPAAAKETVLVVDDEASVRMLVTDVLEDLGYRVIEAVDGASGLDVLRSDVRIDLLVTDVGLPGGMNGRQLADAARTGRSGLKVLFITGYAESAVLNHGHLDVGMEVMTKPFAIDVLASRIRALIAEA